jgi:outer membrane protein assembly factor BamB
VYFGSNDGKLYALNQDDGTELWHFDTGRPVQSTVLRYEDKIIFTSDGGATYFVSPEGILLEEIVNPVWYRDTFQVYDGTIYLARGPMSNPHSLGAYDIDRRTHPWVLETSVFNATWYSFPAIRGDLLYMSTSGYRGDYWEFTYYAFDRRTGDMVWSTGDFSDWGLRPPEQPRGLLIDTMKLLDYLAPAVWRDHVIYTSGDNIVRAFNARTGQKEWEREFDYRTTSSPLVAGNRVYFGIAGDEALDIPVQVGEIASESPQIQPARLVCLSAKTGRVIWEMDVEGALLSAPIVSGQWIVFGTDQNKVYVLEKLIG